MDDDRGRAGRRDVAAWALAATALILAGQAPAGRVEPGSKAFRERVVALYAREAEGYTFRHDGPKGDKLALRREPVYTWTNPTRAGGQDGAIFLWTERGRPEVVGTIFSFPGRGERTIDHEFLSLATSGLGVERPGAEGSAGPGWSPRGAGPAPRPFEGAPAPGRTAAERLAQIRELAGEFSGETRDKDGRRWDLRLLPRPLYRYESTDPEIPDGALFALVSSAGTDPEAILVVEARRAAGAAAPAWHYAVGRYTDLALRVDRKGREVLAAPFLSVSDPRAGYHIFNDRAIPPIEDGPPPGRP